MEYNSSVEKTYHEIRRLYPRLTVDSLQVVQTVEEYRQYWKPKKTKVILLAESHVYIHRIPITRIQVTQKLRSCCIRDILLILLDLYIV